MVGEFPFSSLKLYFNVLWNVNVFHFHNTKQGKLQQEKPDQILIFLGCLSPFTFMEVKKNFKLPSAHQTNDIKSWKSLKISVHFLYCQMRPEYNKINHSSEFYTSYKQGRGGEPGNFIASYFQKCREWEKIAVVVANIICPQLPAKLIMLT